ncbi:MAG: ATP-dependent helicase HrpB, partial [Planctomycetes bacterium]|nr:ATP-dependent helicase HrpB [Planctomycetota bacterium]
MVRESLPIDPLLPRILASVRDRGALVLLAPPGAGKTTRVPPAILDAGLAGDGAVVVLEPRRIAARAAARRVAAERGGDVGGEVGHEVRFDRCTSPATRIRFVTDGVFLRQVADDPFLAGVGAVIFDEFHERSLDLDLSLALARRVRDEARPDLRLLAMSATGEAAPAAAFLGGETITAEGRTFPVEVVFLDRPDDRPLP